jgi:hypothetical protein
MKGFWDLWSIIHFGFWAFIASAVAAAWEPCLAVHLIYTLVLGFVWEIFEYFAQRKWPEKWSHKIEPWVNSWIADPIANLLGASFGWFVVAYYRSNYHILF